MKYLLLLYGDEAGSADASPEDMSAMMREYEAFDALVKEAGVLAGGEGLEPTSAATTLRYADGGLVRTDGPFAETREQLGGFYVLECKDLEEALGWAAKVPDLPAGGSVEVRPVIDYEAYG